MLQVQANGPRVQVSEYVRVCVREGANYRDALASKHCILP